MSYFHVTVKFEEVKRIQSVLKSAIFQPPLFRPNIVKRTKAGKPVVTSQGRVINTVVEDLQVLYTNPVDKYSSQADALNGLDRELKTASNSLKNFVNKEHNQSKDRRFMVVYHADRDDCPDPSGHCDSTGKNGTAHLHIVATSEGGPMSKDRGYRAMGKAFSAVEGVCKTSPVNNLPGLMTYLKRHEGYIMLGSNDPKLIKAYTQAATGDLTADVYPMPEEEFDANDAEGCTGEAPPPTTPMELKFARFACAKALTTLGQKRKADSTESNFFNDAADDDGEAPVSYFEDVPDSEPEDFEPYVKKPRGAEGNKGIVPIPTKAESVSANLLSRLSKLAQKSKSVTRVDLMKWCKKNPTELHEIFPPVNAELPMSGLVAVISKGNFDSMWKKAVDMAQVGKDEKPVMEYLLDHEWFHSPPSDVASAVESGENFLSWCASVGLNGFKEAAQIVNVLRKESNEKNAYCMKGPTTIGKSYWITVPFQQLSDPGVVGVVTNDPRFGFSDCPGKKVLIQDEAKVIPDNAQTYKSVLRGNMVKVDVKHKDPVTLDKTPVLMSSNTDPWLGLSGDEVGNLRARIFLTSIANNAGSKGKAYLLPAKKPNVCMWPYLMNKFYDYFSSERYQQDIVEGFTKFTGTCDAAYVQYTPSPEACGFEFESMEEEKQIE